MAIIEGGLPDEEIRRLATLPLRLKSEIYAAAEAWWEQNKERLIRENSGKMLMLNAADLTYVVAGNYKKSSDLYKEKYGRTPFGGRDMFVVLLKPRP